MSSPAELAAFALRMVLVRIRFRIDAMEERQMSGVSISRGFADEIVHACERAIKLFENPEPERSGLTVVGESAVGGAAGEIGGHLSEPKVDDPAACSLALRRLIAVMPENALDDDDPEQADAWKFAADVIAKLGLK